MPTTSRRLRTTSVAVLATCLLTACSDGTPSEGAAPSGAASATPDVAPDAGSAPAAPGTQTGIAYPDDIDPARLAPLAGLQPCPSSPPSTAPVPELPLPEASIVSASSEDGALRTAQGYSERTPVEIMVGYLRLEGWTVLNAEDEVFESEMLVERDGLRVFVKAQAVCDRGSQFVVFASDDPALVPAPAGAP